MKSLLGLLASIILVFRAACDSFLALFRGEDDGDLFDEAPRTRAEAARHQRANAALDRRFEQQTIERYGHPHIIRLRGPQE